MSDSMFHDQVQKMIDDRIGPFFTRLVSLCDPLMSRGVVAEYLGRRLLDLGQTLISSYNNYDSYWLYKHYRDEHYENWTDEFRSKKNEVNDLLRVLVVSGLLQQDDCSLLKNTMEEMRPFD